jgi:hypothetical protein
MLEEKRATSPVCPGKKTESTNLQMLFSDIGM